MLYHLNFGLIFKNLPKLYWGLLLSLELAVVAIAIGVVIGLALALLYEAHGRLARAFIGLYVEFIRKHGYYGEGISALSHDVVEGSANLAPKIMERFPQ